MNGDSTDVRSSGSTGDWRRLLLVVNRRLRLTLLNLNGNTLLMLLLELNGDTLLLLNRHRLLYKQGLLTSRV